MTLGERIKSHRQRKGLSQEKVAELVGVSRQAVTKWEADQSAPSTENLFRLAEIFGTTVDLLLSDAPKERSTAEQLYALQQEEKNRKAALRRKNFRGALLTAAGYLLIYLAGRVIWCGAGESSVLGWLLFDKPAGESGYLYGWLLQERLFWYAMLISAVPALFGKRRFAVTTLAGAVLGLGLGVLFGHYEPGAPYGHGEYGWAIWLYIFLASIAVGGVWEAICGRKRRKADDGAAKGVL